MKRLTDQQNAERLLKLKKEGFPSWHKVLFGKSRAHILRYSMLIILLVTLCKVEETTDIIPLSILLGFIIGGIVRELVFIKSIGKGWDFTDKVTNWEKVEEMAKK